VLIHLIDGTQDDPVKAYKVIRKELNAYDEILGSKTELVAINKVDSLDADARKKLVTKIKKASGQTPYLISGVTGEGVRDLLFAALETIQGEAVTADKLKSEAPAAYSPWDNN
jgi:GTP-binding protein